jgi:hypothetical protein
MEKYCKTDNDYSRAKSLGITHKKYMSIRKNIPELEDIRSVAIGFFQRPHILVYLGKENKETEVKLENALTGISHVIKVVWEAGPRD